MNTTKLKDLFEKSSDKYADAKAIGTTLYIKEVYVKST